MIETREDMRQLNATLADGGGLSEAEHADLLGLFEALREVARAAKPAVVRLQLLQKLGPVGVSPQWTQRLADAVDALSDWITKDG